MLFRSVVVLHKKQQQLAEKLEAVAAANKKGRKRSLAKLARAKVETSLALRKIPFRLIKWKEFAREIERAGEEMSHLETELRRLQERPPAPANQARAKELRRELRKRRHGGHQEQCRVGLPARRDIGQFHNHGQSNEHRG